MKDKWFCADDDCMQYCQKINDKEFRFIQAVWLDTCGDDPKAVNRIDDSDNYAVCGGYIDLDYYSLEEQEGAISSYGYTMESIKEMYGDESNQIIAECIFEDECLTDSNSLTDVVSWDDAKKFIEDYITSL